MISEAITIEENKTVKDAIKLMNEKNLREIIVVDKENQYKGIIKLRDLLAEKNLNEKIKNIKKRDCKIYEINETEIAKKLIESDCYIAAYLDKNEKVLGMVHIDSLLEKVKEIFGNLKAHEVETKNIIIINSNEPIFKAIKYMSDYKISHLPIIENGKLVGIVSSKDFTDFILKETKIRVSIGELIGKKFKIFENPIISIAKKNVITYSKDEKISNIIKKMFYYKISCIVREDLQGIITKRDLIKPLAIAEEREEIRVNIIGKENVKRYYLDNLEFYIQNFIKKVKKHYNTGFLNVHIEKHRDTYAIHLIFSDYKKKFIVTKENREFLDVLQDAFDALKRQVFEDLEIKKNKRVLLEYLKNF